jgi:subtilisin family serine protease
VIAYLRNRNQKKMLVSGLSARLSFSLLLFCIFLLSSKLHAAEFVAGEVIVKLRPKAGTMAAAAFVGQAVTVNQLSLKASFDDLNMHHFALKPGQNMDDILNQLNQDPNVEFAEPNYIVHKVSATSQTTAPIQLQNEWNIQTPGLAPVIVAIVDTGLDLTHTVFTSSNAIWVNTSEIAGNGIDDDKNGYVDDVNGYNFAYNTSSPSDDEGHGTHCAGIVLGTSQDITAGTLQPAKIKIMPLKFLDSTGSGSTSNAISAINYAVKMGAKVISNSWGGGSPSDALLQAISYAYTNKVLFVAAAGNSSANNDASPTYPANYSVPNMIAVAATSSSDVLANFSNYGATTVHLAAPGVGIYSTYMGNAWATQSGTSMATPFVAGVAAMMLRENPSMSGYEVKTVLLGAVDSVNGLTGVVSTHGRLNAYKSVLNAKSYSATGSQPLYAASSSDRSPASMGSGGCGRVENLDANIWHALDSKNPPSSGLNLGLILFVVIVTLPVALAVGYRMRSPKSKRKFDRFMINSEVKLKLGDRELVGSVSTISLGGIQLNADTMLEKGGSVMMTITGPDGKEQVQVEGRVVWSEEQKHYGVQFANAESSTLASISAWTRGLLKAS